MRNKIFSIGILIAAIAFTGNVYAAEPNGKNETNEQAQQQIKTVSPEEDEQIQTQDAEQIESASGKDEAGAQIQRAVKQQPQEGPETEDKILNQEKALNQIQPELSIAEQRRSQVANAVQEMLQMAEKNEKIGQQVKVIAQEQNQNQNKLEAGLEKIQKRNSLIKFLIGPDYNEINKAKEILEQNREQVRQLDQIRAELINKNEQQNLTEQIEILEQVNLQIEDSLNTAQQKFSLLGWIVKRFY